MAHFEIYEDEAGEYRWRLRASGSHETVADSGEGYEDEDDCRRGIEIVKNQAPDADVQAET